jgi:hypothetical protein
MTDDRRADQLIKAWIDAGPDAASSEFVERTLRPIPRMRQRRSWRIAAGGLTRRLAPLAAGVAVAAIAVIGVSTVIRGLPVGDGPGNAPSPSPPLGTSRPTFELTFGEGATAQVFRSDPTASVATCNVKPDGPSYALYAGGDPFVNIDLLVGIGAEKPGGASHVAAEIAAGDIYVRFDPAVLRGGDAPGRSQATVTIRSDGPATTFEVIATTPDDRHGSPIRVSMTLTCAP